MQQQEAAAPASLAERVRSYSYTELNQKLNDLSVQVRQQEQRRQELLRSLDQAGLAVRHREHQLLLDSSPMHEDATLRELKDVEAGIRQRVRSLPEHEGKLKAVLNALQDEVRSRDSELNNRVNTLCAEKWAGEADALLVAARKLVAQAFYATCLKRSSAARVEHAKVEHFFVEFITDEVGRLAREMEEKDRIKFKAQVVKNDGRLG